jgi:SAM-dependent methyltransferase
MDIGDYNQKLNVRECADKYIVTSSAGFAAELEGLQETFDAVISAHNIEHCEEPQRVLTAMLRSLKKGGEIYLSFPCEASVHFPQRKNTLNFYDDETHLVVPDLKAILATIEEEGLTVKLLRKRYRPSIPLILGFFLEPISALIRRSMPLGSTWALYGFETVIWACRQ